MAVAHFAVLTIEYTLTATGYTIVVTSDAPCHLYMRWSLIHPQAHKKAVTERGLTFMGDVRYCFVAFEDNEQEEFGDTLIHTFIKPDWPGCTTRYFYFHGTIDNQPTPSTSGLFDKHRPVEANYPYFTEPWTYIIVPPPAYALHFSEGWPTSVLTSLERTLSNQNDMAHLWSIGPVYQILVGGVDLVVGYLTSAQYKQGSPIIFRNITIPKNSLIVSATIHFLGFSDELVEVCRSYLKAEKQSNPQPFSTTADYFARPRTTAFIDWSPIPPWPNFVWRESPDISNIIQELINQPWWSSGEDISIFWEDHDDRSDHNHRTERRAWGWIPEFPERMPYITISYYPA